MLVTILWYASFYEEKNVWDRRENEEHVRFR